jgi:hypothetical protein
MNRTNLVSVCCVLSLGLSLMMFSCLHTVGRARISDLILEAGDLLRGGEWRSQRIRENLEKSRQDATTTAGWDDEDSV